MERFVKTASKSLLYPFICMIIIFALFCITGCSPVSIPKWAKLRANSIGVKFTSGYDDDPVFIAVLESQSDSAQKVFDEFTRDYSPTSNGTEHRISNDVVYLNYMNDAALQATLLNPEGSCRRIIDLYNETYNVLVARVEDHDLLSSSIKEYFQYDDHKYLATIRDLSAEQVRLAQSPRVLLLVARRIGNGAALYLVRLRQPKFKFELPFSLPFSPNEPDWA